ncbi:hypothetical protein J26TS2_00840 [Shouchella clausii]|nr:hypothetical protein J26TS2_00840 [Shouchella clausii]
MGVFREATVIANISIKIEGLDGVLKSLSDEVARKQFDQETERTARKMANAAANNAPRETGALKNSLVASVRKEADVEWSFGSDLPYAQRQEYEHATKKAFVRRAVWDNEDAYWRAMAKIAGRIGK